LFFFPEMTRNLEDARRIAKVILVMARDSKNRDGIKK